ncbi:MAG: ferredoxin [Hydrogenophaga sp.]|jgi:hypothetical protein|nr:ferredoxin [Hydrogenophaga sp.]
MYVILTTKPGQFRTEFGPELTPVEAYDYVFYGRTRARFLIAEISGDTRVRIIDETEPVTVNSVPSKFLEKFREIEGARRELRHLCAFGDMDTTLVARDVADFHRPVTEAA